MEVKTQNAGGATSEVKEGDFFSLRASSCQSGWLVRKQQPKARILWGPSADENRPAFLVGLTWIEVLLL